jgi:hypothetical protein
MEPDPNAHLQYPPIEGRNLGQAKNIESAFSLLAKLTPIPLILEIGTGNGGFSLFLKTRIFEKPPVVHTWDIGADITRDPLLKQYGVVSHIADALSDPEIPKLIEESTQCIVLCDNGNKPKEFQYFAQFLRSGDIIMGHDYFKNGVFDPTKWLWCELQESDIQGTCDQYGLVPFYAEEFEACMWASRIKR